MPQLAIRVDDFLLRFEALLAASARHRFQTHVGTRRYAKIIASRLIDILTQIISVITRG